MTNGSEPSLSMRFVQRMVDVVEQAGIARDALLRAAGIDARQLEDADARVPRSQIGRIFELSIDLTGDPALGLHWLEGVQASSFAPLSHLISHAEDLRQAFELLSSYGRLLMDGAAGFTLIEHGDEATIRAPSLAGVPLRMQRFSLEMMVTSLFVLIRSFHKSGRIERVCFEYAAPPYRGEYTRSFGRGVRFGQAFNGIVFERAMLDVPSPDKDDEMRDALRALAERRLARLSQRVPYAQRVHACIVEHGGKHRLDMESVAQSLGLSVRSLRRRLATEGKSYKQVESEALASAAKQLLRDDQRTIQEAAYAMGFSDATTFHRAFKRWTGMTPSAYRQRG